MVLVCIVFELHRNTSNPPQSSQIRLLRDEEKALVTERALIREALAPPTLSRHPEQRETEGLEAKLSRFPHASISKLSYLMSSVLPPSMGLADQQRRHDPHRREMNLHPYHGEE